MPKFTIAPYSDDIVSWTWKKKSDEVDVWGDSMVFRVVLPCPLDPIEITVTYRSLWEVVLDLPKGTNVVPLPPNEEE